MFKKNRKKILHANTGANLLEVVVALGLVGVILIVFSSTLIGFKLANESNNRNKASAIAEAALDALRALNASEITDQTNGSFLGLILNQGNWEVSASSTAPSTANILTEKNSSPVTADTSGLLLISPKSLATSTVEASLSWTPENSASGTAKLGFLMRGRDLTHGYYYSISPTAIALELMDDGASTTLFTQAGSYAPGTWHKLKAMIDGSSFSLYYNDLLLGAASNSTFSEGELAIFAQYALISVDNLTMSGDAAASWNFDSDAQRSIPVALRRDGLGGLPRGRGVLTIEDAFTGNTDLKKATVKIFWSAAQGEKSLEASTLIKK